MTARKVSKLKSVSPQKPEPETPGFNIWTLGEDAESESIKAASTVLMYFQEKAEGVAKHLTKTDEEMKKQAEKYTGKKDPWLRGRLGGQYGQHIQTNIQG